MAALVAGSALVVSPAPARAAKHAAIPCGTAVFESVTLTRDMKDCAAGGLVVAADNVTIDLGGHAIKGTGSGSGITIFGPKSNVRVTNGSIRDFALGVQVQGDYNELIVGVEISHLEIANNGSGIGAMYSRDVRFEHNVLRHNEGWGLRTFEVRGSILDNDAIENGEGGILTSDTLGATSDNRALRNGGIGIEIGNPYVSEISRNEAKGNATDGISLHSAYPDYTQTVVKDNVANQNGNYGIAANPQSWIDPPGLPTDGGGNSARRNENPTAQCLYIDCAKKPAPSASLADELDATAAITILSEPSRPHSSR